MKQELIVKIYTTTGVEHSLFRQKEMLDALAFHQDSYDTGDWPTRCSEFHFDEEQIKEMSKELEEEITYKEIVDGFLLFLIQFSDLIKFEKNNPSEISITIEMY
jgi:hypothetical protein